MSNSPAKRPAAWLALFAVGLSLAANVADWLYVGTGAAVLGAVPPLMLAALLLTLHHHAARTEQAAQSQPPNTTTVEVPSVPVPSGTGTTAPRTTSRPPRRPSATPAESHKPDRPPRAQPHQERSRKGPKPQVSDAEVIAVIRQREQDAPVPRRVLMAEFGLGTERAQRLLAQARNGTHLGSDGGTA